MGEVSLAIRADDQYSKARRHKTGQSRWIRAASFAASGNPETSVTCAHRFLSFV
jgi:hypothetical protein